MENKRFSKFIAILMLFPMLLYTIPVAAFTKDETVYSNAKSNGEKYKTVVTTHIENTEDEEILKDLTNLMNIENTSGDEKFSKEGENLIWEANTEDIYYKGDIDKELPIDISVRYKLDGKEISSKDIVGKTGNVEIIIEYKNNDKHEVDVNGTKVEMYTPFIVGCGTYISNENNKNIEVKNGKIINDGSKTMVIGLAMPGMQESLGINKDKVDIPTTVEISMESKDFEMNNIINYITPKIIEENDIQVFEEIKNIYSKIDELQTASKQIEEGAKTLEEGTVTYTEKSAEFNNAISQFSQGVNTANDSYKQINAGISELNSKSGQLRSGSKQLSEGISAVEAGVSQMQNGLNASKGSIESLVQGASNVAGGLTQLESSITVTDYTQTINQINAQITNLQNIINNETLSPTSKQVLEAQIEANRQEVIMLQETTQKMQALKSNVGTLSGGASQINGGIQTLAGSITTLNTGLETLLGSAGALSKGATTLYNGTIQLSEGTAKLQKGSSQMQAGLSTLDTSSKKILDADNQLVEGAKTISEGAGTLQNGIQEFNNSAIEPICEYINNDVKDIITRAEKLKELSDEYNTFTKINEEDEGKVKFITIIDSIKKDDENNGQEELDKKSNK